MEAISHWVEDIKINSCYKCDPALRSVMDSKTHQMNKSYRSRIRVVASSSGKRIVNGQKDEYHEREVSRLPQSENRHQNGHWNICEALDSGKLYKMDG